MTNTISSSSRQVLVSYSAAQSVVSSGSWESIEAALLGQLPLRNIHWKSGSRKSIRTIQELNVSVVPLESVRDEYTQIPVTLLEKPLLNIFITICQDTDLEGYRNTIRKQIKDWHNVVTARKNQEWLILHIVKPEIRAPGGNFFHIKGTVFEKIRADFSSDRRERCVQVAWAPGFENPAIWAELMNRIKDCILSAFDSAVAQQEEEVKRSESQHQMPGWNFCTYFVLKESLANSFEDFNLFEDAYLEYEELEASFHDVLKEKNFSWFGSLISPSPTDDASPLLSVAKKPYRDLILANTISVFDLRIYLLARQCELLAKQGRINEISRKAGAFLGGFGRRLREAEATLPPFFVESWTYSSALSVVDQCDHWSSTFSIEGSSLAALDAAKGELLELARNQLDVIGVKVGHLPTRPPFSVTFQQLSPPSRTTSSKTISSTEILKSIKSRDGFYELYVAVTDRAIGLYTKAGRRKFSLRLHGSLAALDLHRGHLETALTTYSSLPAHYAPHMWTSLESFMLSRALDSHAGLNQPKDTEWIHILLSFLKSYVSSMGTELLIHEDEKMAYISRLLNEMKHAASALESVLAHFDHPALSIQVSNRATIAGAQDGSYLDVIVRNHLPCMLPADEVTVVLTGRDSERLTFVSSTRGLAPGKSTLTLFCPSSLPGTYVLESSEVRMARLLFQWAYQKSLISKTSRVCKDRSVLVRVPRDLLALDVRLHQPNRIQLGQPPTLLVMVSTGRNHVSKVTVRFTSQNVAFQIGNTIFDEEQGLEPLEIEDSAITLRGIAKDKVVSLYIPYADAPAFHAMKINMEVEYVTVSEPSILRMFHTTRVVLTTLPISVNVEDFFRGTRLFSKFTISTTSHQHVRICAAQLQAPEGGLDGVEIKSCTTKHRAVITVTPAQPANFLFYLDSTSGPVRESLNLFVRYRMLREEVESVVDNVVNQVLLDTSSSTRHRVTLVDKLVEALERDAAWVELYGITGELNVPVKEEEDIGGLLGLARKLLHEHRHPHPPEGVWREINIPVDVPYMNIVTAARIRILSTPNQETPPLYAGQPISAVLTMTISFHWGSSSDDRGRRYMIRFDIEEMVKDWLVSGRKRGDFEAMDKTIHSVPVTLIALHHGELTLPKVVVTALPIAGEAIPSIETYQIHGAERVLVLPRGGRTTFVVGMGSN